MIVDMKIAVPLFEQYGVSKAAVFGSVSRNDMKDTSDVDIIVSFRNRYDLLDLVGLKQDLEEALDFPVDLITYDALKNDAFASHVLSDSRVIYEQN